MTGRGPRPARLARPAMVLAGLGAAFFLIARTAGSGWVTVLLCGAAGCLLTGTVWPFFVVSRATVSVDSPRDATVGDPLALAVTVMAPAGLRLRLVTPPGGWSWADAHTAGQVVVTPDRRGVLAAVTVEVSSAAPLGLVWWRRFVDVRLDAPLEVGPRRVVVSTGDLAAAGVTGSLDVAGGRSGHDSVRSVRPYAPGDAVRLVHWPATARWGEVMVKELEDPDLPNLAILVDLGRGGEPGEEAATRAGGLAEAALRRGIPVWLLTAEGAGPRVGPVASPLDVGRRLARAVPAAPPEGPVPIGALVVRIHP